MGLPRVTEVAKLWKDPELRYTPSGKAVCELPLLFVKRARNDAGQWEDVAQMWVRGTVWDRAAEHAAESLSKGDEVLVSGELSTREFERKGGSKGTSVEMRVFEIGPSLRWGPAKVSRAERSSQSKPQGSDDPWQPADDTPAPF